MILTTETFNDRVEGEFLITFNKNEIDCDDLFAVVMYQQEEHNYACFFYCGTESDWTECVYKFTLDCNYTDLKRCIQSQLEPRLDQWKERIIKIIEKQKSIINVDCVARLYKSTDFYGKEKKYYLVFEDRTEVINYEATEVIQGVTNELQLMRHVNGEQENVSFGADSIFVRSFFLY